MLVEQLVGFRGPQKQVSVLLPQESLFHGMVEELEQMAEIPAHVEQAAGFGVKPQLAPSQNLEKLLERAKAPRQRDETVSQVGHQCLTFVHRINDAEFGQPLMGNFLFDQYLRDYADYLAACGQHGIRENFIKPRLAPP